MKDLELPELPACPRHPNGQNYAGFAGCSLCWRRFYFALTYKPVLDRINRLRREYEADVVAASLPRSCLHANLHHEGSLGLFCDDCGASV